MNKQAAVALAQEVLAWILTDEALGPMFMNSTGTSVDDIRRNASSEEYLGSVLDFLLMDDEWVMAFCDRQGIEYTTPMQARQGLPGGRDMHWT